MENIGDKYRHKSGGKKGQVIEDMKLAATFICEDYPGSYQIKLVNVEHFTKPSGEDERIPGTGLTIVIEGGKLVVSNSQILQELMDSPSYVDGTVRIDPEDATGFWESVKAITPVTRRVVVQPELIRNMPFDQLPKDYKTLATPEEHKGTLVLDEK